jgi:hypothetical protein
MAAPTFGEARLAGSSLAFMSVSLSEDPSLARARQRINQMANKLAYGSSVAVNDTATNLAANGPFCFSVCVEEESKPQRGEGVRPCTEVWSRIEPGAVTTPTLNRTADPKHTFAPLFCDAARIRPQRSGSAGAAQICH